MRYPKTIVLIELMPLIRLCHKKNNLIFAILHICIRATTPIIAIRNHFSVFHENFAKQPSCIYHRASDHDWA